MALATDTTEGEIQLAGDLAGDGGAQTGANPQLTHIGGLTAGQYNTPKVTVDTKGRVVAISEATPAEISAGLTPASTTQAGTVQIGDNLYITTAPTAGYATVDFSGTLTVGTATGLNTCGIFSTTIQVDGGTSYTISDTGANLATVQDVLDLINGGVTGVTASVSGGNIKITSDTTGRSSLIDVSGDNLFSCITGYVQESYVDGTQSCEIYVPVASSGTAGVVKTGSGITNTAGTISVNLSALPIATTTTLGTVIVPTAGNIDVDGSGNISIPTADENTLGVMMVGEGLTVDVESGTVSVNASAVASQLPIAEEGVSGVAVPGVVSIGDGIDIDANGHISVDLTEVAYQDATEGQKGIMQPGVGLSITTPGVVDVEVSELPTAAIGQLGVAQPGTGLTATSGVLNAVLADTGVKGIVEPGDGLKTTTAGVLDLKPATGATLGGVIAGSGITIDGSGTISATAVPDATYSSKGIIQVTSGTGLDLTSGVLSGNDATTGVKGVVRIGSNIDVASGVISVPDATTSNKGVVQIGSTLDVTAGVVDYNLPDATDIVKGGVTIGSNIDVTSGEISVATATNTTLGLVKSADTNNITIDGSGGIDIGLSVPTTDSSNLFTAGQAVQHVTLSSTSNATAVDASTSNFFITSLTEDTELQNPTSAIAGQVMTFIISSSSYTLTFDTGYMFRQGIAPVNSIDGSKDIMTCVYDGTNMLCSYNKGFALVV